MDQACISARYRNSLLKAVLCDSLLFFFYAISSDGLRKKKKKKKRKDRVRVGKKRKLTGRTFVAKTNVILLKLKRIDARKVQLMKNIQAISMFF